MRRAILVTVLLLLIATPAMGADRFYVHLVAKERDGDGEVEITLPFAFVSRVARAVSATGHRDCHLSFDLHSFDAEDLRRAAMALRRESRPVVLVAGREEVTFSRGGGVVSIRSDGRRDVVVTRISEDLFFAAFPEDRRIDIESALNLLVSRGGGELLMSSGDDAVVRVWVDRRATIAKRRVR
jgi:hypothetical protein